MRQRAALVALAALVAATLPAAAAVSPAVRREGGVNVEPSMRPWRFEGANPDGWWCRPPACNRVENGTVFVERELRLAAALRVATLRLEFPWPLLEPSRGAFDWRRSDHILRRAAKLRVPVHVVLVYTPVWAGPTLTSPPALQTFARFASAFARRYRALVRWYELWNEPDLERYWSGAQAEYVRSVLVPGYRAIHAADPEAEVILGGPSVANLDWFRGVFRLGGGRAFDIAAFHDYSADRSILDAARAVRRVLSEHGAGARPIWLGEYGLQEAGLDDRRHQALIRTVLTEPAPIAMAQWYNVRDDHAMTCCPPHAVVSETFGLLTDRYEKKGSYEVMRRLLARSPRPRR